jgi:hypothetical protein
MLLGWVVATRYSPLYLKHVRQEIKKKIKIQEHNAAEWGGGGDQVGVETLAIILDTAGCLLGRTEFS